MTEGQERARQIVEDLVILSREVDFSTSKDSIRDAADELHHAIQQRLVMQLIKPVLEGFVQGGSDERNRAAFEIAKRGVGEQARLNA